MYTKHFDLKQRPFSRVPSAVGCVMFPGMKSCFDRACEGIDECAGPILVVGPSGCGKSTLLAMIEDRFQNQLTTVTLNCASIDSRHELIQCLLFELGLPFESANVGELRLKLIDHLKSPEHCPDGLLLLVDEAHNLSMDVLEELRMITNMVCGAQHQIRLVIAGGRALEEKLTHPQLESFSQRIGGRCYLQPMSRTETMFFALAQLQMCGRDGREVFQPSALEKIYDITDGVPRLVTQLCDQSLKMAALENSDKVESRLVQQAWLDLQQLPPMDEAMDQNSGENDTNILEFGSLDDSTGEEECLELEPPLTSFEPEMDSFETEMESLDPVMGAFEPETGAFESEPELPNLEPEFLAPEPVSPDPEPELDSGDPKTETSEQGHAHGVESHRPSLMPFKSPEDDTPTSEIAAPEAELQPYVEQTLEDLLRQLDHVTQAEERERQAGSETNETIGNCNTESAGEDSICCEDDKTAEFGIEAGDVSPRITPADPPVGESYSSTPEVSAEDVFGGAFDDEEPVRDIQSAVLADQNRISAEMTSPEIARLIPEELATPDPAMCDDEPVENRDLTEDEGPEIVEDDCPSSEKEAGAGLVRQVSILPADTFTTELVSHTLPTPRIPEDDSDMLFADDPVAGADSTDPEPSEMMSQGQVIRMNYQDLFRQLRNQNPNTPS